MWLISGEPAAVTYPSLAELKAASSAVIVGRIASVEPGPDSEDEDGNISRKATVMIDIEDVLVGQVTEAEPGVMKLRTVVGWGTAVDANLGGAERLDAGLPRERAILFVLNVAVYMERMGIPPDSPLSDSEAYRIVGGYGFIRDVDGVAEPPAWITSEWPADFRGRPFDEVVEEVARS